MNPEEKTAKQILLEAASILEEEGRWCTGDFFTPHYNSKGCAMCAHGAITYCANPQAKQMADNGYWYSAGSKAYSSKVIVDNSFSEGYVVEHFGQEGLAHHKAVKMGLTYHFNDDPNTTQQDIVRKLREAANS